VISLMGRRESRNTNRKQLRFRALLNAGEASLSLSLV
jgi:hypothetical protein